MRGRIGTVLADRRPYSQDVAQLLPDFLALLDDGVDTVVPLENTDVVIEETWADALLPLELLP